VPDGFRPAFSFVRSSGEFNQPLNEKVEEKFKHKADGAHRRSAML
jgi:hypothetical protein